MSQARSDPPSFGRRNRRGPQRAARDSAPPSLRRRRYELDVWGWRRAGEPITAEVFLVIFALTGALGALCGGVLLDRSYAFLSVAGDWRPSWSGIVAALPAGCGLLACLGVQGLAFVRRSGVRGWSPISSAALFLALIAGAVLACRLGAPEAMLLMLPGYLWIAFVPGREHEYRPITVLRS